MFGPGGDQRAVGRRRQCGEAGGRVARRTEAGGVVEQPRRGGHVAGALGLVGGRDEQFRAAASSPAATSAQARPSGNSGARNPNPDFQRIDLVGAGRAGGGVAEQAVGDRLDRVRGRAQPLEA